MTAWLKQLSIGSHLEVLDKYDKWCIGIVEEIEDNDAVEVDMNLVRIDAIDNHFDCCDNLFLFLSFLNY